MKKTYFFLMFAVMALALATLPALAGRDGKEGGISGQDTLLAAKNDGADVAKKTYDTKCAPCHNNGIAGAPKPGSKEITGLEKSKGLDGMLEQSKKGKGAMPPKGNCADCSDENLKAIIKYMVNPGK